MKDKIKHWWYTYIKNDPKKSPYYNTKYEVTKRVLNRIGLKTNKTYELEDGIYFSASIDMTCGDVAFVMSSGEKIPTDITKSYMVDAHNFLHMQYEGEGFRQHLLFVQHEYFKGDETAKFNVQMLMDIMNRLIANVNEVKKK